MSPRLSRRGVLLAGAAAGGLAAAGGGVVLYGGGAEGFVDAVIRKSFPDARIAPEVTAVFARDYLARREEVGYIAMTPAEADFAERVHRRLIRERIWRRVYLNDAVRERLPVRWLAALEQAEQEIVTLFALSTDVFGPTDPEAGVTYIGYADPFERGCLNPFAEFGPEEPETAGLG